MSKSSAIASQPSSGFTRRVARSFLGLALLTVSMVGAVAYICGRIALKDAAYDRLSMTATLKQKEIVRWLESCEEDFLLIAQFPTVTRDMQALLSKSTDEQTLQGADQRLSEYLAGVQETKPKFTEISIQNKANQIVLSTDPGREGKYEMSSNLTELSSVIKGEDFSPNFYLSPKTGRPAITYATKIYDDQGNRQGTLLATLNLKRIDDIVSERTGPDKTGETYLVGSLSNRKAFLSQRDTALDLSEGPQSEGITAAFNGLDDQGIYNNYAGEPVIGVYRWLDGQDIALLAEMSETEAFGPARNLATTIVLVGLGAAGILLLGVGRLARQLSRSRKQIESYSKQLEVSAAEANAANQAKSDFLANMSHELRTPLNAILGFTQLIQRDSDRYSPHHDYLGIVSRSGEHLLNLINDVLSMSKIEAGRTSFAPVCFDLRQMLLTLEEMLRMRAESKAIQLYVRLEDDVPQFIKTDEVKLRQVLVNLVGNSIKFTQTGQVTLYIANEGADKTETDSLNIKFTVEDTGVGIEEDALTHLFDPFFQASSTRTTQQGTGLGLAISQRFVEMMGGSIHVQSQVDEGSTFTFSICAKPANPKELPVLPIGEVIGLASGQPNYRILIVEDILSARQLMVALLSQVGFEVRAVSNGEAAIAQYKSWQPHLIWMDVRMPGMDGYETTKQIKAIASNRVKIIAITASAFEKERKNALNSGCDDFVRKPFQTHTIFEKMAEYLGVDYVYRHGETENSLSEEPAVPTSDVQVAPTLDPDRISAMPSDWIERLQKAVIAVDAEALHQLISQIPTEQQPLAEALTRLVQNFCFDELVELTQAYV